VLCFVVLIPLAFGFKKDFAGWLLLTLLHMWMVFVRLRLEGKEGFKYQQKVFDAFWIDVESRMIQSGVVSAFIILMFR
jgi:hypothetical protein